MDHFYESKWFEKHSVTLKSLCDVGWWDEPVVVIKLILSAVTQVYFLFHLSSAEVTDKNIFLEKDTQQYPDPPTHLFHKVPTIIEQLIGVMT